MTLLPSDVLTLPSGNALRFVEYLDENEITRHRYECWRGPDRLDDFKGLGTIMHAAQIGFEDKTPTRFMIDGSRRHEVIYLHNIGELNEAAVRPEDRGYLDSWRATVEKFGVEILGAEVLVADESRGAATRIDVVGRCELSAGRLFTANVKTGDSYPCYGPQTAMEALLMWEAYGHDAELGVPAARIAFYLRDDGKAARPVILNDDRDLVIARWAFDNGGARKRE